MSEKRCCDCEHFGLSKDPIFRVITGICGRCGKEVGYTDKCLFEEESFDKHLQRFNLDEGRIWEAVEGLSPFKTTYTLEEVCEKLNEQQSPIEAKDKEIAELDQQCADFLGDKIKALEEFEECTDKLKQKIFDYKFEIKKLKMENDALRYALKYVKHIEVDIDVDGVIEDE